jgi:hypothetical protein
MSPLEVTLSRILESFFAQQRYLNGNLDCREQSLRFCLSPFCAAITEYHRPGFCPESGKVNSLASGKVLIAIDQQSGKEKEGERSTEGG